MRGFPAKNARAVNLLLKKATRAPARAVAMAAPAAKGQLSLHSFFTPKPKPDGVACVAAAADEPVVAAAAAAAAAPPPPPAAPAAPPPAAAVAPAPATAAPPQAAPPPAKRAAPAAPCAAAAPKRANTKAKAGGGASSFAAAAAASKARFRSLSRTGMSTAAYVDECIEWALLRDGRELLIGAEVWHVPEAASSKPVKLAQMAERENRFAALDGLDALATVATRDGMWAPQSAGAPRPVELRLRALPGLEERAVLTLPFAADDAVGYGSARDVRHVVSAPGAGGVLLLTARWLFFARVSAAAADGALALSLDVVADMADAASPLGAVLAQSGYSASKRGGGGFGSGGSERPALVQSAALWTSPEGVTHALLGSHGRVLLVPLAPAGAAGGSAGALRVLRTLDMHFPMRVSDAHAAVHAIAIRTRPCGAATLVTVGSDGNIATAALHDGDALITGDGGASDSWHATRRGSGYSKQYCYAAASILAVHSPSGVAFAGSWSDPCAHVFDLDSAKSSAAGKLLSKIAKVANGRKVTLFLAKFAPRSGMLAYSNSNASEEDTMVIVRANGKK
jgi:hypothetical protein